MRMHERIRVMFVGGPRHGQVVFLEDPPSRIEAHRIDGSVVPYEVRSWDEEGAGEISQAIYAPVAMPREEYEELLEALASALADPCS